MTQAATFHAWGMGLVVLGLVGIGIAMFGMDTTVGSGPYDIERTYNIGLLQEQLMVFQTSCGLSIAGMVAICTGAILNSLNKS